MLEGLALVHRSNSQRCPLTRILDNPNKLNESYVTRSFQASLYELLYCRETERDTTPSTNE